jgi:two-component SAPR family response regulator
MKVRELIKQLETLYLDSEIFIWVDGERISAHSIDDSFIDEHWFIDINGVKECKK